MNDIVKINVLTTNVFFNMIVISMEVFFILFAIMSGYFGADQVTLGVSIGLLCLSGVLFIGVVVRYIQYLLYYILIDDETITLYRGKKIVKQINIADIKSLVLGQIVITRRSDFNANKTINSNTHIVINEGTFFNKKWTRWSFRKKLFSYTEGWIAIEYSAKRYAQIKQLLPNCEIETCTIYDK